MSPNKKHPRKARFLISLLLGIGSACAAPNIPLGHYIGSVRTEWLRGPEDERRMVLLDEFTYVDPKGRKWVAPKGYKTDGASIPKAAWSIVGGPFEGQYREAAVIHDVYCESKTEPWRDVHRIFYYANRAAGVSEKKSKILYGAVMIGGPKWGSNKSKCFQCHDMGKTRVELDAKGQASVLPPIEENDVKKLSEFISNGNPTLEEIDDYVKANYPSSKAPHEQ
jgi:hypothetical protein